MITYYVHRRGETVVLDRLDDEDALLRDNAMVWADVRDPTAEDAEELHRLFNFHPLSIEDALQSSTFPKVESYGSYLYAVLHGIDFKQAEHAFETQDVDFFLGRNFLVTVQDGNRRSIAQVAELCRRNSLALGEGPAGLMHRIVDHMVDHYRPEVDELEDALDELERRVVVQDQPTLTGDILAIKRDLSSLRRIVIPQRDVLARLSRREFSLIGEEHAYRFRDVYDQLVRLTDDAIMFQDRVSSILDAHLATVSNQLASVSKVLAALAVILGPLTVTTGIFGMNVVFPDMPGGDAAQFWWIIGGMGAMIAVAYIVFRGKGWL